MWDAEITGRLGADATIMQMKKGGQMLVFRTATTIKKEPEETQWTTFLFFPDEKNKELFADYSWLKKGCFVSGRGRLSRPIEIYFDEKKQKHIAKITLIGHGVALRMYEDKLNPLPNAPIQPLPVDPIVQAWSQPDIPF